MLQLHKIVQVSDEDAIENKNINDEWFDTTMNGSKWEGVHENGDMQKKY